MTPPRWLRRLVCLLQGHNLVGLNLPVGWSWQTCHTCRERVRVYRRQA